MTTMIPRTAAAALILLVLCGCPDERRSSFEQERQSVQKALKDMGELLKTSEVRQNGIVMESSWEYEFEDDKETAIKVFRAGKLNGYESIRQGESEFTFARFDGHDSFQLLVTFAPIVSSDHKSTAVSVLLKGYPD